MNDYGPSRGPGRKLSRHAQRSCTLEGAGKLAWRDRNVESIASPPTGPNRPSRWGAIGEQTGGHRDATKGRADHGSAHGLAGTMFVCAAPPLGRRPEHRIDRLTPIRPQMGRLAEHGALLLHLTWCMQKRASPG